MNSIKNLVKRGISLVMFAYIIVLALLSVASALPTIVSPVDGADFSAGQEIEILVLLCLKWQLGSVCLRAQEQHKDTSQFQ